MSADEFKNLGNAAMQKGDFAGAVEQYSKGIELDPSNHLLYSNRSAAYASLNKFEEALKDGEKTIELNPQFAKGYSRKGLALFKMGDYEGASAAYSEGLKIEPNNELLLNGRKEAMAQQQQNAMGALGQWFADPNLLGLLAMNPSTKDLVKQPDFLEMMKNIQTNPSSINMYMSDPRILQVLQVLIATKTQGGVPPEAEQPTASSTTASQPAPAKAPEPAAKAEEKKPAEEISPEKKEALAVKEKGNELYKQRKFPEALECYSKCIELDPTEMSFLTNRASVYMMTKEYEKCIADCEQAIEVGRTHGASFELIAKAYARIGGAYHKMGDYDKSVQAYQSSLTECNDRQVRRVLREVEKEKAEKAKKDYMNPELALKEKELGNECFRNNQFPQAIEHYSEAIKRDENNAALYSNRAAAFMKLGEFHIALRDCEKCLEIDPTFVRAMKRKINIHIYCKDFHKAVQTIQQIRKVAPSDEELPSLSQQVSVQSQQYFSSLNPEQRADHVKKAQQDPALQEILRDSEVMQLIQSLEQGGNRANAQTLLAKDDVRDKFDVLVASGILGIA